MAEHSIFAPSSMHRFLSCPASFAETQRIGREASSVYARKGTLKHDAFTKIWPLYVQGTLFDEVWALCKTLNEQDAEMNREMPWSTEDEQHVLACCDYVKAQLVTCGPRATIEFEQHVSLASWGLPDVWGTADVVIHDPDNQRMIVDDHKFGQGVPVYATDNVQCLIYLAAAATFPLTYNEYTVCILQPPLDNFSDFTVDKAGLEQFVNKIHLGIERCKSPDAEFNPSTEACKFCVARNTCRARYRLATKEAQDVFSIAQKMPDVTNEEKAKLAKMLTNLEQVKKNLFADIQATIMNGDAVPGWKVVAGRSIRKWKDEGAAMKYLLSSKSLTEDQMFEEKFVSPSKAEKINRKLKKDDAFKELIIKPMGKPQLVEESDRRPDYDINATADGVFSKVG